MPPRFCLCTTHWNMVPTFVRRRVVEAQRRGLGPFARCTDCEFVGDAPEDALTHIRATRGHIAKVVAPPLSWPTDEYRDAAKAALDAVVDLIEARTAWSAAAAPAP